MGLKGSQRVSKGLKGSQRVSKILDDTNGFYEFPKCPRKC